MLKIFLGIALGKSFLSPRRLMESFSVMKNIYGIHIYILEGGR